MLKLSVTLGFQVACQERSHYTTFAACLKPLVTEEVAMLREVEQLDSVMEKISKMISDPYRSLDNCEDVLSLISQSDERFGMVSATPPGSPGSTLGSRTASLRSVRLPHDLITSRFNSHLLYRSPPTLVHPRWQAAEIPSACTLAPPPSPPRDPAWTPSAGRA